ncbi:hypothetical protein MKX03_024163 [Papaver bracteatum]|nr:hypothetical protein MKX03_024163 [Papaver bracteatum]
MAELGGAVLGAVVSELLKAVLREKDNALSFRPYLERLNSTLEKVIPKAEEIKRINQVDNPEVKKLMMKLSEGINLVEKCSTVQSWNYYLKSKYSRLLQELDNKLIRFLQLDVQTAIWCDPGQVLVKVNDMDQGFGQIMDMVNDMSQKIDQLTAERGHGSSPYTGAGSGAGIEAEGVHDQKAAVPTNRMIIISGEDDEKLDRLNFTEKSLGNDIITSNESNDDSRGESIAPTAASINALDATEMPLFRDDESVAIFSRSMGGVGKTSLSQRGQKDLLRKHLSEKIRDTNSSSVTPYKDLQLVVTRFHSSGRVDFKDDFEFHQVKESSLRYMELVERVSQENVAPLRAYYYSCRSTRLLINRVSWPWRFFWCLITVTTIRVVFLKCCMISANVLLDIQILTRQLAPANIYSYGVLLLELVTGNTPRYSKESQICRVRKPLESKVEHVVRCKQWNLDAFGFQVLDCKLLKHYEEYKGQLIQILQIALNCVSERALKINDVVKMVRDLVVPKFRDDDSIAELMGGVGRTSLPQELDLMGLSKITRLSQGTLYESAQLVSVSCSQSFRPTIGDWDFNRVKMEHHRHMELVERVSHENVAPLRAYHYSFGSRKQRHLTLWYDYNRKGSVYSMLHVAIGVAKGIAFIHAQDDGKFYHGDIGSHCIFLNAKSYGCISDLGRCIGGYTYGKPFQQSDIYNYGVLLLELVTGKNPRSNLVSEFNKYFIGSTEFRKYVTGSTEQVLDCELLKDYEEYKGQMIQMLQIAVNCVSEMVPKMDDVVKMVEGIGLYDGSDGSS